MPPSYKNNPYGDFSFQVALHGDDQAAPGEASFADVSGPEGQGPGAPGWIAPGTAGARR